MNHPFEDVEIKENAPELLEHTLKHKRKRFMIGTGAMTDPYIPLEEKLENLRKCIEIIYKYGFGFTVLTKSNLVLRDLDLLKKINEKTKCVVQMTLTTHSEELCKKLEPNVCTTKQRFEVLKTLRDNNIPTVVWLSPILPFINDTEENISGILDMCIEAKVKGVICFDMGLTLREGNREYFYDALDKNFPGMKEKYIKTFKDSYVASSPNNYHLMKLFEKKCEQNKIMHNKDEIFYYLNKFEDKEAKRQLSLW